ncbi:hypothetical protein TorRG33x02_058670 [Trema orientale]|uniref:Uncharacterized protein n=1 Tax=Trema orientale TaxID=63057 RepID=A0A2P5FKG4_TREOI|nr:hypothetical protein TorRG33x02_058670 [Trema orientale]
MTKSLSEVILKNTRSSSTSNCKKDLTFVAATEEFLLQLPLKGFQDLSLIEESSISVPHVEGGS